MENKSLLPIGVFDSGVGGLTVLNALQQALPQEIFLYLGDMARLPYGTKSPETVIRYARQAAQLLINRGVKCIIVACNTVSALALTTLQQEFPGLPIIGVIEPGAKAACLASVNKHIAVIATEATIRAQSYQKAINKICPEAIVTAQGCSLFVSLAEEGWLTGLVTKAVAERYLEGLFKKESLNTPDCLVLGCTHFPVLISVIQETVGKGVCVVDSAKTTADLVVKMLQDYKLTNNQDRNLSVKTKFLVTDDPSRFIRVAKQFLGLELDTSEVELVDIC